MTNFKKLLMASAIAIGFGSAGIASANVQPNLSFNFETSTFNNENLDCGLGWSCIGGEGAAPNTSSGATSGPSVQYVDWLVAYYQDDTDGGGGLDDFYYFYQVENSGAASFTLGTNAGAVNNGGENVGYVLNTGFGYGGAAGAETGSQCDLDEADWLANCTDSITGGGFDLTGLNAGFQVAHVVTGEINDEPSADLVEDDFPGPLLVGFSLTPDGLSASFSTDGVNSDVTPNEETGVFGAKGSAPVYTAFANIGAGAQTWNSDTTGGIQIAAPGDVPEPATMALMGLALLGAGAVSRRKRNS